MKSFYFLSYHSLYRIRKFLIKIRDGALREANRGLIKITAPRVGGRGRRAPASNQRRVSLAGAGAQPMAVRYTPRKKVLICLAHSTIVLINVKDNHYH